jgi:hypothetical protein
MGNTTYICKIFGGQWRYNQWAMLPIYIQSLGLIWMSNRKQFLSTIPLLASKNSAYVGEHSMSDIPL